MSSFGRGWIGVLGLGILLVLAVPATAQPRGRTYRFDLPAEALGDALRSFGQITQQQIIFSEDAVRGKRSPTLVGTFTVDEALRRLLGASRLRMRRTSNGVIYIEATPGHGKSNAAVAPPRSRSASHGRSLSAGLDPGLAVK